MGLAETAAAVLPELGPAHRGYAGKPIPDPLDHRLAALVDAYGSADDQERAALRAQMTAAQASFVGAYGVRMASRAVREQDTGVLEHGLTALALSAAARYHKEVFVDLAAPLRAAELLEADADALFAGAASAGDAPEWFAGYPGRQPAGERNLEVMGLAEGQDADGFRIVPAPAPPGDRSPLQVATDELLPALASLAPDDPRLAAYLAAWREAGGIGRAMAVGRLTPAEAAQLAERLPADAPEDLPGLLRTHAGAATGEPPGA